MNLINIEEYVNATKNGEKLSLRTQYDLIIKMCNSFKDLADNSDEHLHDLFVELQSTCYSMLREMESEAIKEWLDGNDKLLKR